MSTQRFSPKPGTDASRGPSVSRRGNCWANAVAESFFSSLKKERIQGARSGAGG